MKNRKLFY